MGSDSKYLIDYIIKLAYPNKNIIWKKTNKSSIIVKSNFEITEPSWNIYDKPYIYWSGESYNTNDLLKKNPKSITILSATNKHDDISNDNIYHIPYCCLKFNYKLPLRRFSNLNNKKLLGYCNSNPIKIREKLVTLIAEKANSNEVFALGKCVGYSKKIIKKKINGIHSDDNMIKEYSNYKFVIAMENKIDNGYITEKIINAFTSGAIPIYWGDPVIAKNIFNENAFICVNNFNSLEDCAEYIIQLNNDEYKLNKMKNEPIFKNNIIPDVFQIGNFDNPPQIYKQMADKIKKIIDNN